MTLLPHGTWPGTTTVDDVLHSSISLQEVRTSGSAVYWSEGRPSEDGRSTVMTLVNGEPVDLTRDFDVRSRVMEYGGGAWDVDGDALVIVDDRSGRVLYGVDGIWRSLSTDDRALRHGDLRLHTAERKVFAVQEDHRPEGEPVTRLVEFSLDRENALPRVVAEGATFYADPEYRHGHLAWCEWDHPNMPWDATRIMLDGRPIAEGHSSLHPRWADDALLFADDRNGYWNWHLATGGRVGAVTTSPHDHEAPLWTLGNNHWTPFPLVTPTSVVGLRLVGGVCQLVRADLATGAENVIDIPGLADIDSVAATSDRVLVIASFTDRPSELLAVDPATGSVETLVRAGRAPAAGTVSVPDNVWVEGDHGRVQAWYYPPRHPEVSAPDGDLPPLIVLSHGGPTAMAMPALNSKVQYWTSRGFAVVDVNYGGSTGFGRDYRERLKGRWGIVDVDDCRAVVEHLVATGRADAARVAITGGSAGGYTTLQSLVTTDVYTAGVSRYGIGDLATLISDTHKFEARYPEGLVGPWPQAADVYAQRSPIKHVDRLATPMLILQGTDDKVVPPSQSQAMADAVKRAGQPVALVMFPGEGHGFRSQVARRKALLSEHAFYAQLWGLASPDDLPGLTWL